ncbi:cache domain-containing sensor histidine kinase [Lacrimispora sp.]|jgi:two-component system sensor histidine kinase YesM|uniref:cache domain-containing sensor histidine kinase n=1 Tax=Lacrimispora sp. TaxID=2719234 RepID=UPI0028B25B15|nr:histidine kinase [Lacrimispora sp.]
MQKKFFMRRFKNYCLLLIIPTFLVFLISFVVVNGQINRELDAQARNTLSNINTNLDFVVSSVVFQNDQLTNNSYMVLALKKLFKREPNIQYSDAIYLRNIKTMMQSIIQSYPYIQSVYLYLDGYDSFFSSQDGVMQFSGEEDQVWRRIYLSMEKGTQNRIESRRITWNGKEKQVLTIYQRMLLLEGTVVMNLDVDKYRDLLSHILLNKNEILLFYNQEGSLVFSWPKENEKALGELALSFDDMDRKQNQWIHAGGKSYLLHTEYNNQYRLKLVSLIPFDAKTDRLFQMFRLFGMVFVINSVAMLFLAYFTTKRTFVQLIYMIQVFHEAESGIYPTEPKKEMKDEYDVIMNNIIYLFLQTVRLNASLVQKQHEQEVAQLTALQLQINPHFLFNTLQNVQLEISKLNQETGDVSRIIDHLSDILKYTLANPMEKICLREEVENLKKYVAIQNFRFSNRIIAYYEIQEELMDFKVFRLMLQPLVENSILHGLRHKEGMGYIKVQIFKRKGFVHFRVIDNGAGMDRAELLSLEDSMKNINVYHIGLANVSNRLKLHFGEEAGIRIKSKKHMGCVVEFVVPEQKGL